MAGGDVGPCGCEVLGCGFDVGDAPGDDGVGEQSESFALDVLAVGVSAAESLISAISCSTDVATSRGYALEPFGALSLQTLRVAITTAGGRSLHQDSDPSTPHATAPPRSPHPTRRSHPITAEGDPRCRTTRNRYISSKYSRDPDQHSTTEEIGRDLPFVAAFLHREPEVGEGYPVDLLRYQVGGPLFGVEVEVEGEPAPVSEAVLPQRRAALERQVECLVGDYILN